MSKFNVIHVAGELYKEVPDYWYALADYKHNSWLIDVKAIPKQLNLDAKVCRNVYQTQMPLELQTQYLSAPAASLYLKLLAKAMPEDRLELRQFWNSIKGYFVDSDIVALNSVPLLPLLIDGNATIGVCTKDVYSAMSGYLPDIVRWGTPQFISLKEATSEYNDYKIVSVSHLLAILKNSLYSDTKEQDQKLEIYQHFFKLVNGKHDNDLPPNLVRNEADTKPALHEEIKNDVDLDTCLDTIKELVQEQIATFSCQQQLLQEASSEISTLWGGWNHPLFVSLFDNERIITILSTLHDELTNAKVKYPNSFREAKDITDFVKSHMGKLNPKVRDLVAAAQKSQFKK